jgi:E3 ubiquitin-protein ligase UBR4
LEEGVRRWYDLPFTNVEALLAEEEFSLFVGPTFGGFSAPRIDSLEVYGRSKDDFGWKEKLEAILDMEVPGFVSDKIGDGGKNVTKNASMEEQVIADCFMLLSSYYLTIRMKSARASLEASSNRCKPLLELAFESDTQPLLQEAARNCLRALYPAKDSFYQVITSLMIYVRFFG